MVSDEGRSSKRSGHTPPSVGVRVEDSQDMDYSSEDTSSSSVIEIESTASVADLSAELPGTTG